MLDFSFSEMMVVGVVALVVLGPERLPRLARTLGALVSRAQRYVNDVKSDINREIEMEDVRKFRTSITSAATELEQSVRQGVDAVSNEVANQTQQWNASLENASASIPASPALSTPSADLTPLPTALGVVSETKVAEPELWAPPSSLHSSDTPAPAPIPSSQDLPPPPSNVSRPLF